jgi:ATP-binding cassette subfamily B protein
MTKEGPSRFRQIIYNYLRQLRWSLLFGVLCMFGLTLTDLLRPWPIKIIFDHILSDRPTPHYLSFLSGVLHSGKLTSLVCVSSGIIMIAVVRGALSYFQVYTTSRVGNQLVYSLRRELFAHIQRLSLSFHNRARSGELLTKVASDTNTLKDVFADLAITNTSDLLTIVGVFAIMFALNWELTSIVLATFPFLLGNLFYRYRRAKASARRQRKTEERIATRISEALTSVLLVQAFGRERYEEERFDIESSAYVQESVRNARVEAMAARAVEILSAAGTCAVVLFGSWQVLQGKMTLGGVVIFTSYLQSLYRPLRNMAKFSTQFSKAVVSAQRIAEVLEIEPAIKDDPTAIKASHLKGGIVFSSVSFDYGDGKGVLKDVSFAISPGQRVALVGTSGAGKSTLISLILRLYDPQCGTVSIDGVDVRKYQRESLRRQIGIVLQNSILLGASIKENIAYGKLDATMEEIIAAARASHAHEFIMRLEDGYDTLIGERGATLSGGQQQRIAIARALVRNAPILILDEPMTGLDGESEANVLDAFNRLMAGKTCLLITHDLQAVMDADLVLVLEEGRIVEQGRHSRLMAQSRRYRQLYDLKLGRYESQGILLKA